MSTRFLLVSLLSLGSLFVTATPVMAVWTVDQEQVDACCGWNWGACPTAQTKEDGVLLFVRPK